MVFVDLLLLIIARELLYSVRFEVFTAVRMMMFFWFLAPCRLVGR
jgi:hypothetical protein